MQVQIIGSGGFLGSRLMDGLARAGHRPCGVSSNAPGGIDPLTGLLSDTFAVPHGTDAVVYLATSPYSKAPGISPGHLLAVNVLSAVRAAQAASRAGVKRFVYASTGNVYLPTFEPASEARGVRRDNWYSLTKLQAEEALALYRAEMEVTVLRLFGAYGPGQTRRLVPKLVDSVLAGRLVTLQRNPLDPNDVGGLRVSLCYVDDLLGIMLSVVSSGGPEVLNVAGPTAISVRDIASAIGRLTGREANFQVTEEFRDMDLVADISLLNRHCRPKFTDFETGLLATLESAVPRRYA